MIPESLQALITSGTFPRELRLGRWPGPTLFTSELHDGTARRLDAFRALAADEEALLVLGTARETQGFEDEPPVAYAAFCLTDDGRVVLVDLEIDARRFVASSPVELFKGLTLFAREWSTFEKLKRDELAPFLSWLQSALQAIDARAFRDRQDYWSSWLKVLGERAAK